MAEGMAAWSARKTTPRKGVQKGSIDKAKSEIADFIAKHDWSEARPIHFVALYLYLHVRVYGFEPSELASPTERQRACIAASQMLKRHFEEDGDALADFMRWLWKREKSREDWRRENGREGGKISWRVQFGGRVFDEYRADLLRRKA